MTMTIFCAWISLWTSGSDLVHSSPGERSVGLPCLHFAASSCQRLISVRLRFTSVYYTSTVLNIMSDASSHSVLRLLLAATPSARTAPRPWQYEAQRRLLMTSSVGRGRRSLGPGVDMSLFVDGVISRAGATSTIYPNVLLPLALHQNRNWSIQLYATALSPHPGL